LIPAISANQNRSKRFENFYSALILLDLKIKEF